MKKNHIAAVVVGIVVVLAAITNPNQQRHKEVLKSKLNTYLQKSLKTNEEETDDKWGQAGQMLGAMIGGAFIEKILDNIVSTDNYILFSTTKITWQGKNKTIGIGAFGNVYITEEFDKALNEGLIKSQ